MATYTENYQLHQWVPEDDFLRTDFNTDFQKIDAALGALSTLAVGKASQEELDALESAIASVQTLANGRARAIMGSYTGDGSSPREISVGASPRAVALCLGNNTVVALNGGGTVTQVTVTSGGFRLESGSAMVNSLGKSYRYMVLA